MKHIACTAILLLTGFLSGCISWASYPAAPGEIAVKDPNQPVIEELMMSGMRWVVQKYPPVDASGTHAGGGRIAFNLPFGVRPNVYRRVCEAAGGGAEPLTPDNASLPIYHVRELRIRGDQAQMNVVFPASTLGASPKGGPVYQEVKIGFQGGLRNWRVSSFREWGPGAEPPEPNFYVPEPGFNPNAERRTLPPGP